MHRLTSLEYRRFSSAAGRRVRTLLSPSCRRMPSYVESSKQVVRAVRPWSATCKHNKLVHVIIGKSERVPVDGWAPAISYIKALISRPCSHKPSQVHTSPHKQTPQPSKSFFKEVILTNKPHPRNAFPLPLSRCRGHHLQRQCCQLLEIRSNCLGRQHLTQHPQDLRLPTEPRLPPQRRALPMRAGSCWCEVGLRLDGKKERNNKCGL